MLLGLGVCTVQACLLVEVWGVRGVKEYRGCVGACLLVTLWVCRGVMECKGACMRVGCGACFWWRYGGVRGVKKYRGCVGALGVGHVRL